MVDNLKLPNLQQSKKVFSLSYGTCYSCRSEINSMWILENPEDILDTLNVRLYLEYYSINLYTTIPHTHLKSRLPD